MRLLSHINTEFDGSAVTRPQLALSRVDDKRAWLVFVTSDRPEAKSPRHFQLLRFSSVLGTACPTHLKGHRVPPRGGWR